MMKKLLMDTLVPVEQKNKKCTEIRYTKKNHKSVVLFLYAILRERGRKMGIRRCSRAPPKKKKSFKEWRKEAENTSFNKL